MIDIIIPAYNAEKTITKTLSSLVSQTDYNFEVYVIDDNSSDNIENIIQSFKNIINIHYIKNKENIGAGMSRQVGIDNSHNEYFTFLDADDVFLPYTIELLNNFTKLNPSIEFLHSGSYVQKYNKDLQIYEFILEKGLYTQIAGKLYKRSAIEKYNIKNNPVCSYWGDDSYFNCQCTELLKCHFLDFPTYMWLYRADSATHKNDDGGRSQNLIFLKSMYYSSLHILKHKDKVLHLPNTLQKQKDQGWIETEEEKYYFNEMLKMLPRGGEELK